MGCGGSTSTESENVQVQVPENKPKVQEDVKIETKFVIVQQEEEVKIELPPIEKVVKEEQKKEVEVNITILQQIYLRDPSVAEQFKQIFENSKQSGQLFLDSEFPADETSLSKNQGTFKKGVGCNWLRLSDLLGNDYQIFQGKIEPNDIRQGTLGDCYFLSSLSCLAERQFLISRLFETKKKNEINCYCVWICHDGMWKQVILDEFIPCKGNYPVFSRCQGNEVWVLLLEKAYAKIFGSYEKIESGVTFQALRDLTGAPGLQFNNEPKDPDASWKFLTDNSKKNYILTAGSLKAGQGKESENEKGIISSHAYAILDVREVKSASGQERILQLRNPWGKTEWQGDWGDKSDKWTDDLKKELGWSDADDGLFWMPIQDFVREFSNIGLSMIHDNYFYTSTKVSLGGENKDKGVIVKFTIDQPTHAFLSLIQADKRNFAKDPSIKYEYSLMKLVVCRGSPDNIEQFIVDSFKCDKDSFVEARLEPGQYFVYFEAEWVQDYANDVVVSAYSENQIKFEQDIAFVDDYSVIERMLVAKPPPEKITTYKQNSAISNCVQTMAGYVCYMYSNASTNATLKEKVKFKLQYLQVCPPHDSPNIDIKLSPGEKQNIIFKILPEGKGAYSYSNSSSYSISTQQ